LVDPIHRGETRRWPETEKARCQMESLRLNSAILGSDATCYFLLEMKKSCFCSAFTDASRGL
jgi:hypothetical protein